MAADVRDFLTLPGDKIIAKHAEPLDGPGEFALAGKDGRRVGELLRAAERRGREAFARLTEQAVRRLLADPQPATAPVLFSDEELNELKRVIAATTSTADLLGRARVQRLAANAREQESVGRFAEPDFDAFSVFDDSPDVDSPEAAVDWFRTRVNTLDLHPERYAPRAYRQAAIVATAADEVLLQRIKDVIAKKLATGQGGPADVQELLDAAGVSTRNPNYADAVVRTSLTTSYMEGQAAELSTPTMQDMFPCWVWHTIVDGRERDTHRSRDGKYYPSTARFTDVRGHSPEETINCRCSCSPVSRAEWERLQRQGVRLEG